MYMDIKILREKFSICKVVDYSMVDFSAPYVFVGKTEQENSLVCQTENVPANAVEQEDGFRAMRMEGVLDFSLIGIVSKIATILADNEIAIFTISTYNTDYILVKEDKFKKAVKALVDAGYWVL